MFRRNPKPEPRTLTGVSAVLSASHRDQESGQVHGHTWRIRAWFYFDGTDQRHYRSRLDEIVKRHDHTCLPDRIAWGEHLARYIYNWLNDYTYYTAPQNDCAKVQVIRTDEDIWAEYPA